MNRRLSFGIIALLLTSGCSRAENPGVAAHSGESVAELESFEPMSAVAADSAAERARLIVAKGIDGKTRPALPAANVIHYRANANIVEAIPSGPRAQLNPLTVRLPRVATDALTVRTDGMHIEVKPKGFASSTLEFSDRMAVYREVQPKTDAFRVVNELGVEDFYYVADARDQLSFSYDVTLNNVAGLRLVADTLEFLDTAGTPQLRVPAPIATDTQGRQRVGQLRVAGCAYDTNAIGPWGRPVTAPGAARCTVTAIVDGRGLFFPVLMDPAWQPADNAKRSHAYHKMVYLTAGADRDKVLLLGGTGSDALVTELFDPTTKKWATSSSLPTSTSVSGFGAGTNAVQLANGSVFIAGGFGLSSGTTGTAHSGTALRDPATGTWTMKATMDTIRAWHVMVRTTVDSTPGILVAGGQRALSLSSTSKPLGSTQFYDPATDSWLTLPSLLTARTKARAVVLTDGRILIAGGETYTTSNIVTNTAEIFTPSSKTWTATGTMTSPRTQAELVALPGGKAVIAGGAPYYSPSSTAMYMPHDTLEVFDGSAWTTLTSKLSLGRWQMSSALTPDGKVLFSGGQYYESFTSLETAAADLFVPGSDPTKGTVVGAGTMVNKRTLHASVTLPTLGVLVAGGLIDSSETTLSELFDTRIGGACPTTGSCPSGTNCIEGVCCAFAGTACPTGQTCKAPSREGVCTKPNGSVCGGNNECASGYCVGGFCCESACTGTCNSCDATGKCIKTPAGKLCQGQPECGRTCDAAGVCSFTYIPAGTKCGASASDAGTGSFCTTYACGTFGSCLSTTNNCGLTCTTSVTCNEATKTCTPIATGIKAGFCVIAANCYSYGDINPKDSCQVCDPPTSKTAWSTAISCMDGSVDTGVEDTGAVEDTGSTTEDTGGGDDTGSPGDDTGTAGDDTGASAEDASADAAIGADLPEASTCGCRTPGGDNTAGGALAALGIALAVAARRRRD